MRQRNFPVTYLAARQRNVDVAVMVGRNERHLVRYRWSNWSGRLRVDVDGQPVLRKWLIVDLPLLRFSSFTVGVTERHLVTFVKERPFLLPWLRPRRLRVSVDGAHVLTHAQAALQPTAD